MPKPLLFGKLEVASPCPRCKAQVVPEVEWRTLDSGREFIVLRCPGCGFVPPHVEREKRRGESLLETVEHALRNYWC